MISTLNVTKSKKTGNLVTFTEETVNGKLHFFCSDAPVIQLFLMYKIILTIIKDSNLMRPSAGFDKLYGRVLKCCKLHIYWRLLF